jgi:ABC-type tungstate transport system substrate-binding protein
VPGPLGHRARDDWRPTPSNRVAMNKVIHGLILLYTAIASWFLWAMLKLTASYMFGVSEHPPLFTQFCVNLRSVLFGVPALALGYCLFVWLRRTGPVRSWTAFLAVTTAGLILAMLPTLIASWLPVVQFMEFRNR